MSLLDYSSWLFQLVAVVTLLYLVVGLARPSWVLAQKRSTVTIISVLILLIASTAFYLVVRDLPGGEDTPAQINAETPAPSAQPSP